MNQPRATRLSQSESSSANGWLSSKLPPGSLIRTLVLGLGIPLIALIIVIMVADLFIMPLITRQGSDFTLPDYAGQRVMETQVALNQLDLLFEVSSEEFSPGKPQGVVLQQFPRSGTKVKPGRTIKFVVSLGERMVTIPDLAGKSVRQAMLDLETNALSLGEIAWAFSDTIPERIVVFSYPSAGTNIPIGSAVNLMVNRGRASNFTFMPKVVGSTLDEATQQIVAKSLKLGVVSYRNDENYLPETVLEQSEPEGAELDVATEIDLVISSS